MQQSVATPSLSYIFFAGLRAFQTDARVNITFSEHPKIKHSHYHKRDGCYDHLHLKFELSLVVPAA